MRIRNIFIAALVALSMLIVSLSAPPAMAKPSGSFDAASKQEWQGNTKGAWSQFWIDTPGLGSGEHWERYIEIATSNWSRVEQFGVEKCGGGSGGCPICGAPGKGGGSGGKGAGLFVFESSSGNGIGGDLLNCDSVPTDDINNTVRFSIYENSIDTSLIEFDNGLGDLPCSAICPWHTGAQTWYHIQLVETLKATFTGHKVYGGDWIYNQWMDSNHNFHYQTNAGFMRQGPGNPPQMGWNVGLYTFPPAPGGQGGRMGSCDYDTGQVCSFRS